MVNQLQLIDRQFRRRHCRSKSSRFRKRGQLGVSGRRLERIPDVHHHGEADYLGRPVELTEGILHRCKLRNSPARLKPIWSDKATHWDRQVIYVFQLALRQLDIRPLKTFVEKTPSVPVFPHSNHQVRTSVQDRP